MNHCPALLPPGYNQGMDIRRNILSVGYSATGIAMGLAAGSNMLDELPIGLMPAAFLSLGAGLALIYIGRRLPQQEEVPPDRPPESN